MIFETKEIRLKDGRTAILRSSTPADAAEMLLHLEATAAETPFMLRSPGENTMTVEQEARYLQDCLESEDRYMILCMVDGKIAGSCQLARRNRVKNRHRASVAIGLNKEFWGLGIGTAMFGELIAVGKNWDLMQLELEVIEGNDRAMALYKKMGFEVTGFIPNAIRMPDGTYAKEYQMVKPL